MTPNPLKRICILGSTGSIGRNTLRVISDYPDRFHVTGLAAFNSTELLLEQVAAFKPEAVCLVDRPCVGLPGSVRGLTGMKGLVDLIEAAEPDLVVVSTVGYAGLAPTLKAIGLGIPVALANKEVLVTAGELVMSTAREMNVKILPIDSEHNAIFQCLSACDKTPLRRIILTASGGPFRGLSTDQLSQVSLDQALSHPTWKMGKKITIDSATLMNKGFEVIEVYHLFNQSLDRIEVVVHPQSVIHGMIEYHDGSMLAQMGVTDMYLPICNVLSYPDRLPNDRFTPLDLAEIGSLTFEAPDKDAFPCLQHAYDAVREGGTCPTVLNAANEVAVDRFLNQEIQFLDIPRMINQALQEHTVRSNPDLGDIIEADRRTRLCCDAFMMGAST
jgi:1-deoxy-D-xylulose-5-phosphate reductoisomerase